MALLLSGAGPTAEVESDDVRIGFVSALLHLTKKTPQKTSRAMIVR